MRFCRGRPSPRALSHTRGGLGRNARAVACGRGRRARGRLGRSAVDGFRVAEATRPTSDRARGQRRLRWRRVMGILAPKLRGGARGTVGWLATSAVVSLVGFWVLGPGV